MPSWSEVLGDRSIRRQKSLRMPRGFEALHTPLPLAGRPMRVLAPVIEVAALTVFDSWQYLTFGRAIAFELIRDDDPRDIRQAFEELTKKLLRRLLVTPPLHEDVEDRSIR
jgi:hypothetical protein